MMSDFTSLAAFQALLAAMPGPDATAIAAAADRNGQLTKPPGALGRLEEIAQWVAGWQGTAQPRTDRAQICIFAGNHGVAARGVSAFPAEVTAQMVLNFVHGGAAINQLAKTFGAKMTVEALDLETPTADFTEGPAMSEAEVVAALQAGWNAVDATANLLVVGEMGIGNTTAAAAIATALYGGDWVGRGTGVDDAGLARKGAVVAAGLAANPVARGDGLQALRCLGGREIAAMAGAMARARALRIPLILDGFIACAAAACLAAAVPGSIDHTIAGHLSAEGAHGRLLGQLGKEPLLSLGLRLGEGSGAALAIAVVRAACACQSGMATFAEAGVAAG
ncbi:MAG: nicotinate-nucleotide--dimethylbenzimidazole phosphoribosyltransferase [Rhodobacteraceae bacterium]|nr:nicotinate-nucleotide--dimethylbenzimidazole phosphoribosyltransferase [Paracoccaceae bacterium]